MFRLYFLIVFSIVFILPSCQTYFVENTVENIQEEAQRMIRIQNARETKTETLDNLTVQDCIQKALSGNLDYTAIRHRILQSHALLMSATAETLPVIGMNVRYFHADSPAIYFATKLDQRGFRLQGDLNSPDDFGSSRLSFGFMEKLNLAGREFTQKKIANLNVEILQLEEDKARNILVDQIILAYYDILASYQYVNISEQSVQTVSAQLQETKVKFEGGGVLKSDVLALEVRLATAKEEVIRAKNRVKLATSVIGYLMGLTPNTPLTVKEEDWQPTELPTMYQEGLSVALAKRAEIHEIRKQVLVAKYGINVARSYYWPDLEVFGSYYWEDRDFKYSKNQDNWQVGVSIQWNIFDGMRTQSKVWQAEEMYQELLQLDEKTVLGIQHEVHAAYLNWQEAQERAKVLEIAIEQANENLTLVKKQFEGGAATITKYLDTELAYTQAKFQWTTAQYDIKKAKATVGKSLGLCGLCAISGLKNF